MNSWVCTCTEAKKFESPDTHVLSWGQTRHHTLPSCFSSQLWTNLLPSVCSETFFTKIFVPVVCVILLFQMAPKQCWDTCCLALWLPYGEYELRSGMSYLVLLTVSSVLPNQKYVLNNTSLNRNPRVKRLCIDQLGKMLLPEAYRKLPLCFS